MSKSTILRVITKLPISGQDYLLFPFMTVRTTSLTYQGMYFVELVMNLLIPTVLPAF